MLAKIARLLGKEVYYSKDKIVIQDPDFDFYAKENIYKFIEILGFATNNPKKTTIKKKRPPEEDSVKDKLAKRRAMAAKGDPDAYKTGAVK
jgi:hypothetical protein